MHWDYWRLITTVSVAGFVGLLFDQMLLAMFIATFFYAMWLQGIWNKLYSWLKEPKKYDPPSVDGVIDDICREIERVSKQNKSRKKRLRGYLKQFQAATAALPDAVVVMGEFGKVEWANKAAQQLLGIRWPQDSHVRVNNLIRDPEFHKLLHGPISKDSVAVVASPIRSEQQLEVKIVNYMGKGRLLIARDMTQTIKLQRMRRDFVANVSHELRTPLTVLHGYLEMFTAESSAQQWGAALPVMQQQTQRMDAMIKDLLTLSQLEMGEKPLGHRPVDVGDLLRSIVKDAEQLQQHQQHTIKLELESNKLLLADSDELRSAVSNLVFNAVKYTPAGSTVTIRWTVNDKNGCIEVSDNGHGIAEHHLDRLTERFYRVDSGRSQEAGGTGLGLAIVKHILQRHGAELRISSEVGAGSQFCCYFPLKHVLDN
ncbi:MAG: phosphate regulon sensor histidine kinase PhoR [Methylophaga sp.]|nr:phosphate regulon sensor histidine kinase PhoR [Methylophaga sp.]